MWIQYVISVLMTLISSVLVYIVQSLIRENKKLRDAKKQCELTKDTALSNGVMSLLKIQLIEYHDKYMQDKHIPSYVYENWDVMYKAYKDLGGNGMIERMDNEIHSIELKD